MAHLDSHFKLSLIIAALFPLNAIAEQIKQSPMEVITISQTRTKTDVIDVDYATGSNTEVDLASWLSSVPGANINRNGPVSGIAQYRGLYGDRISTTVDGHGIVGAGPNAMDSPLSYATPLLVDSMTVYRGIAPVSAGINTLGGAIEVKMRKAQVHNQDKINIDGDVQVAYAPNNDGQTASAVFDISKGDWAALVYGNNQTGDDIESANNETVSPSYYDKVQSGLDLRFDNQSTELGLSYHYTDTQESGTPALPMDIGYVYSHRLSIDGSKDFNDITFNWLIGYLDADHEMDNFTHRDNANLDKYRSNHAIAQTYDFKFSIEKEIKDGMLTLGVDGIMSEHNSTITNPNNAMFRMDNFNDVEDERFGLFVEWQQQINQTNMQLGIRYKEASNDSGDVYTSMSMMPAMSMMPGMTMMPNMGMSMGALASDLMMEFNNSDKDVSDENIDIALTTSTELTDHVSLYVGLGLKNRAPSYQERYLWMPMESTGGLADGNTYIGDINLDSETAYQTDIGITYQSAKWMISPHIYYQKIDDYIQGTPLTMEDSSAQMLATMMGKENTLKFSNVEASLYGLDVNAYYHINDEFHLSAIASYVRGKRDDINDDLYRIAPLNAQVTLSYLADDFVTSLTLVGVAAQNDVSRTNKEQASAGYGLLNAEVQYYISNDLTMRLGVNNILDKQYQDHLGGYNRVQGSDIAVMDRLPKEGINSTIELTYHF
ncbi:MAG: TonB-dependent receptor [Thalassotalea sp.]|nr:TonB-dependent receptor [Thalassotalea sp.]MDG2393153.1 TonB-dependent receptor [Thalassotalea sp.]